jgi:transcriptional regulator with XRE-family HTH domain
MISAVVQRMRAARESKQISREKAAVYLDVDFSTIGRWERFKTKDGPPLWAIVGYARMTGTPLVEMLGEDAPREALDAAVMRMLADKLKRLDRDWDEFHAQFGEFFIGAEPHAK